MIWATIRRAQEWVCAGCGEGDGGSTDFAGYDGDGFLGSDVHRVHEVHAGGHDGQRRADGDGECERLIALLAAIEHPFLGDKTQDVGRFAGFEKAAVAEFRFVEAQGIDGASCDGCLHESDRKKSRSQREEDSSHDDCDNLPNGDGCTHRSRRRSLRYRGCLASTVHGVTRRLHWRSWPNWPHTSGNCESRPVCSKTEGRSPASFGLCR